MEKNISSPVYDQESNESNDDFDEINSGTRLTVKWPNVAYICDVMNMMAKNYVKLKSSRKELWNTGWPQ